MRLFSFCGGCGNENIADKAVFSSLQLLRLFSQKTAVFAVNIRLEKSGIKAFSMEFR